jgi:hypothetical protein
MMMRYYGGGIGHLNNTPPQQADPLDSNPDEMDVEEDNSEVGDNVVMIDGELEVDETEEDGSGDKDNDDGDSDNYDYDSEYGDENDDDSEDEEPTCGSDNDEENGYGYASP